MKRNKLFILLGLLIVLFFAMNSKAIADGGGGGGGGLPPNGNSLSCGNTNTFNVSVSGYACGDHTSVDGGCNPSCYAESNLNNDGLQDIPFSVENSQWFQFCSVSAVIMSVSIAVDEPDVFAGCNLQGIVWTGDSIDVKTIDCGKTDYHFLDSSLGEAADGFPFLVFIPSVQCAFTMVDEYIGRTCSVVGFMFNCPYTGLTLLVAASSKPTCSRSSSTLTANIFRKWSSAYYKNFTLKLKKNVGFPILNNDKFNSILGDSV